MKVFLRAVPGLLLLCVLVAAVALVGWMLVSWFLSLKPETQTPVAALTGVVLVPLITFTTTRHLERRRLLEAALRDKKTALYDEMVKGLMAMFDLGSSATKKMNKNPNEFVKFFGALTPRLITYGSRGVIRAWNTFRSGSGDANANPVRTMVNFENLLKAMRKDLGHKTIFQAQGELLGMFVNDLHRIDFKAMAYKVEAEKDSTDDVAVQASPTR